MLSPLQKKLKKIQYKTKEYKGEKQVIKDTQNTKRPILMDQGPIFTCKHLPITICNLMDFPIHIDTISMGLPIVYFKGSQVEFSK